MEDCSSLCWLRDHVKMIFTVDILSTIHLCAVMLRRVGVTRLETSHWVVLYRHTCTGWPGSRDPQHSPTPASHLEIYS